MTPPIRLLPLLLLSSCLFVTEDEKDRAYDRDGDGFDAVEIGGTDCDDSDIAVHPDADERCGNGIDDDCDGVVDDDGVGAISWYEDVDGDGYGAVGAISGCVMPVVEAVADLEAGEDCDDRDHSVHPNAVEVCRNGVDDDCDGTAAGCQWEGQHLIADVADIRITDSTIYYLEDEVSFGDVTGDGRIDVLVGGYGARHFVFELPSSGMIDTTMATATFERTNLSLHGSTAAGDFNGDGINDVAIGEGEGNLTHVFYGPVAGTYQTTDADVELSAPTEGRFGWAVTALPDRNADGADELVVSAPRTSFDNDHGDIFVFDSPLFHGATSFDANVHIYSSNEHDGAGRRIRSIDMDGDGVSDLVVSTGSLDISPGSMFIVPGPLSPVMDLAATPQVHGVTIDDLTGFSSDSIDFNQDGIRDLIITSPGYAYSAGKVSILLGPFTGTQSVDSAAFTFDPGTDISVSRVGLSTVVADFNGDDVDDIALSASKDDSGGQNAGVVYVFFGPHPQRSMTIDDSDAVFVGPDGSLAGGELQAADFDEDGHFDLFISANSIPVIFVLRGNGL